MAASKRSKSKRSRRSKRGGNNEIKHYKVEWLRINRREVPFPSLNGGQFMATTPQRAASKAVTQLAKSHELKSKVVQISMKEHTRGMTRARSEKEHVYESIRRKGPEVERDGVVFDTHVNHLSKLS